MSKDINLAGKVKKNRLPVQKLKLIRRIAVIVAITTTLFAILTFFISIQFSLNLAKADQVKVESQLNPYQQKIAQVRLLKDKLALLEKIDDQRKVDLDRLDKILSQKPADIEINSLAFSEKGIELVLLSGSLSSMNDFIDSVKKLQKPLLFKSIRATELKYQSGSGYQLTLNII